MPARWVIHVVGPNHRAGERDRSLLTSCYANALAVADELGARTVAFPLISAGIYGWPKQDAVAAAVETLSSADTGRGGAHRGVRRGDVRRWSGRRLSRPVGGSARSSASCRASRCWTCESRSGLKPPVGRRVEALAR